MDSGRGWEGFSRPDETRIPNGRPPGVETPGYYQTPSGRAFGGRKIEEGYSLVK
jgi:hypothetical protein